jgi:hypothetical protein
LVDHRSTGAKPNRRAFLSIIKTLTGKPFSPNFIDSRAKSLIISAMRISEVFLNAFFHKCSTTISVEDPGCFIQDPRSGSVTGIEHFFILDPRSYRYIKREKINKTNFFLAIYSFQVQFLVHEVLIDVRTIVKKIMKKMKDYLTKNGLDLDPEKDSPGSESRIQGGKNTGSRNSIRKTGFYLNYI